MAFLITFPTNKLGRVMSALTGIWRKARLKDFIDGKWQAAQKEGEV